MWTVWQVLPGIGPIKVHPDTGRLFPRQLLAAWTPTRWPAGGQPAASKYLYRGLSRSPRRDGAGAVVPTVLYRCGSPLEPRQCYNDAGIHPWNGANSSYVLAHAFALNMRTNPDLVVAVVICHSEAETAPLDGYWRSTRYLSPARDGAPDPAPERVQDCQPNGFFILTLARRYGTSSLERAYLRRFPHFQSSTSTRTATAAPRAMSRSLTGSAVVPKIVCRTGT